MWNFKKNNIDNLENTPKEKIAKRKIKLNIFRIAIALVVVVGVLWLIFGFSSNPDKTIPETYTELVESSPMITEKGVALVVDGVKIDEDIWNYYFTRSAKAYAKSVGAEISEVKWNEKKSESETVLEFVKYNAINDIIDNVAITSKAKSWGIEMTAEDADKLTELDGQKELYGDNVYKELGIKEKKTFDIVKKNLLIEEKVRETVSSDIEKYSEGNKLDAYADSKSGTFKIIEIPKEHQDEAKKAINDAKDRLDKGETFDKVWKDVVGEFNKNFLYDAKAYPGNVYIYKDSVAESHAEMGKVGLSLKIGEISSVVETDYSYVILKRIGGYTEIVNMVASECDVKINREILDKAKIVAK